MSACQQALLRRHSNWNMLKNKNPSGNRQVFVLVAEAGLEPAAFGL